MYAELCNYIKDQLPEFQDETDPVLGETKVKKVTFKRCLLNKCQEEFERADRYREEDDEETAGMGAAAKASKTRRVRIRMLGNIKFIGELFAQKILNEKIMHDCVKRLLKTKEEDTIECLCKLMATIGKLLDREEARHYMDYYFDQMKQTAMEIGANPTLFPSGNRLKFMILDTIDLRKDRCMSRLAPVPTETHGIAALGIPEASGILRAARWCAGHAAAVLRAAVLRVEAWRLACQRCLEPVGDARLHCAHAHQVEAASRGGWSQNHRANPQRSGQGRYRHGTDPAAARRPNA
jgi:hypothetical protein